MKIARFDTGDDCIAIKAGRNADGRRVGVPSQDFIIRNCTMRDGHGGLTVCSEISVSCSNVFVENCRDEQSGLRPCALRLKSNAMRGGTLQNILHAERERRAREGFGLADRFSL